MKVHQAEHTISMMGRVLKLSRAGYYAWLKREKSMRERENEMLTTKIRLDVQGFRKHLIFTLGF